MAGIGKRKSGLYCVRFIGPDGIRRTMAIGTKSERQATLFAATIENLVVARKNGFPAEAETLTWLSGVKEKFRKSLIQYGVIGRFNSSHWGGMGSRGLGCCDNRWKRYVWQVFSVA
jgi:hypothetical protein